MGFLQDAGSFLGNIFGINQSAGADKFRDIGTSNLGQGATNAANAATTYNNQAQQYNQEAQGYNQGLQSSLGANAGQTMQKAVQSAQQGANVAGRAAGSQAEGAARTAGLNKGQASLQGGQASTQAYQQQLPQQIGNYMNAANQFQGAMGTAGSLAGQMGNLGVQSTGQQIGAGQAASQAATGQGAQAQQGGGGLIQGVGAAIAASDKRLKKDMKPDLSLDEILKKVRPITYNYKNQPEGTPERMGVLAQDLEKTPMKAAVIDTPQGKMINTNELSPMVLDMLLQLGGRVKDLESGRSK